MNGNAVVGYVHVLRYELSVDSATASVVRIRSNMFHE